MEGVVKGTRVAAVLVVLALAVNVYVEGSSAPFAESLDYDIMWNVVSDRLDEITAGRLARGDGAAVLRDYQARVAVARGTLDHPPDEDVPQVVTGEYVHPDGWFYIYWVYEGNLVHFYIAATTNSWMGLGFSMDPEMPDSDMIVCSLNPTYVEVPISGQDGDTDVSSQVLLNPVLSDRHSDVEDRVMPIVDPLQDVTYITSGPHNGWTIFSFRRLIDTGDEHDIPLDEAEYILYAYGPEEFPAIEDNGMGSFHYHEKRGIASVNLPAGEAEHVRDLSMEEAHASLMLYAWGLLTVLAIFCSRYMKDPFGKWWFYIHAVMGSLVFLLTIAGFLVIVTYVQMTGSGHFDSIHKITGLFVVLFMCLQVGLGYYTYVSFDPQREEPPPFPDKVHWWNGRLLAVFAYLNIFSGFILFEETGSAPWVTGVLWFFTILIFVAIFEFFFRGDIPSRSQVEREYELLERGIKVVDQNNTGLVFSFWALCLCGFLLVSLAVGLLEK